MNTNLNNTQTISYQSHNAFSDMRKYIQQSAQLCTENMSRLDLEGLLNMGADPNFYINTNQSLFNVPPVIISVVTRKEEYNHIEKLKILLDNHADINISPPFDSAFAFGRVAKIPRYSTALSIAIEYENVEAVELLLEYKPKNRHAKLAFSKDNKKIKNAILSYPYLTPEDLNEALKGAQQANNKKDILLLKEKGAVETDPLLPRTKEKKIRLPKIKK